MEKRNSSGGEYEKPSWDWSPIQCTLKMSENGRKSSQWQLTPSILLTNPLTQDSDPNVRLFIDTEKSLTYSPDLGWNWHKSWNLPNISIRLQVKDQITGEQLLSPKNMYAQIIAVKKNSDNDRSEKLILQDVGIRGDNKMEMIDGQVYFSAMKFSSTSYNNEGQNFHLLIVIYIQQNQLEKPKVLTAVISPEIFVDSRRSARDYQEKKFNSFVELFGLDQLDKQFIKRENKNRTEQEIQIKNDSEGFYNYLTAPNIRHKVKHPLFLAIRFSNCANILYNQKKFKEEETEQNRGQEYVLETLQRKLLKESQSKNTRLENLPSSFSDKYFIIYITNVNDSLKRKKVLESIESLELQSTGVTYDQRQIPSEFTKLPKQGSLSKLYKDCYESLKEICKHYVPSDIQSSEEESEEQYNNGRVNEAKKTLKISKMENNNGYTYEAEGKSKGARANIVCQTITTPDRIKKKNEQLKQQPKQQRVHKNHPPAFNQNNESYSSIKDIKREEIYSENINNGINLNHHDSGHGQVVHGNNPYAENHFTLDIGSKKGSAFNNLRNNPLHNSNPISHHYPNHQTMKINERISQQQQQQYQQQLQQQQLQQLQQQQSQQTQQPNNYQMNAEMHGFNPLGGYGGLGNLGGLGGFGGLGVLGGMCGLGLGLNGYGGLAGLGNANLMNQQSINQSGNNKNRHNQQGLNQQGLNQSGLNQMQNMGLGGLGGLGGMGGLGQLGGCNGLNMMNMLGQGQPNYGFDQQSQNKSLQNFMYNNLILSNWINSVKMNNSNLKECLKGENKPEEISNFDENSDLMKNLRMSAQPDQQSVMSLLQQIGLYRELLTQVAYQNSLLQRSMSNKINNPHQNQESEEKKPEDPNK